MEEFGILGFGIRNPRQNPESRTVLDSLTCGDKAMLSPQVDATKLEFINDFIHLDLAASLAMKIALRADINRVNRSLISNCMAWTQCIFLINVTSDTENCIADLMYYFT